MGATHMRNTIKRRYKERLSRVLPYNRRISYLVELPKLHDWVRVHADGCPLLSDRFDLYRYVNETVIGARPINYLEFGVFEGASIRAWAQTNCEPASDFVGFDTFEGVDEPWALLVNDVDMKTFDVNGTYPSIDDGRVRFVKGYFQDTLPEFLQTFQPAHRLVVHCDADLYSSTLYTLSKCDSIMAPGTVVVFDEFSSIQHEFRALADYCAAYRRDYRTVAATKSENSYFDQIAIELR